MFKQKLNKRSLTEIKKYKEHFFKLALLSTVVTVYAFFQTKTKFEYVFMSLALFFHFTAVIGSALNNIY